MKKVAVLIDEMFEDSEFIYPYYRLMEAGFCVDIVAPKRSRYYGKKGTSAKATHSLADVKSGEYTALYIPGGYAPDKLRREPAAVSFVKSFCEENKPVCALCHGPSLLISAGVLRGKRVTAFPLIKDDIENAGAFYTANTVEIDGNIVTATDPAAMPQMMRMFLNLLTE